MKLPYETIPGFEIPADATAAQILAAIDRWAREQRRTAEDYQLASEPVRLHKILSALRGPDDENAQNKTQTTAWIRLAALPYLCAMAGAQLVDSADGHEEYWATSQADGTDDTFGTETDRIDHDAVVRRLEQLATKGTWDGHFQHHIQMAAEALLYPVIEF